MIRIVELNKYPDANPMGTCQVPILVDRLDYPIREITCFAYYPIFLNFSPSPLRLVRWYIVESDVFCEDYFNSLTENQRRAFSCQQLQHVFIIRMLISHLAHSNFCKHPVHSSH